MFYYENRCVSCGRCAAICPAAASTLVNVVGGPPHLTVDRDKCVRCLQCTAVCLAGARGASGQQMSVEEILREVLSDKLFYDNSGGGVTLSGGDPLMYPEFSLELAKHLHAEGVHVAMETSCFPMQWKTIEPLVGEIDLFIVDIKSLSPSKHQEFTEWPLEPVLRNIKNLFERNANVRIHIPLIPHFNDTKEDFAKYADFLGTYADHIVGVDILPYHGYGEGKYDSLGRIYKFKGVEESPAENIVPLVAILKSRGVENITVGGLVGITCARNRD